MVSLADMYTRWAVWCIRFFCILRTRKLGAGCKRSIKMYEVGDKIVYPMHGAGVIESIEEKEFLGEKLKYYVMRMPLGEIKIMIPINKAGSIGIRSVIDKSVADMVLNFLEKMSVEETSNWNRRYRENMKKIKSGNVFDVAEVVKTLTIREKQKGLSTGEWKMLNSAKRILISELVFAENMEPDEIENIINCRIKY